MALPGTVSKCSEIVAALTNTMACKSDVLRINSTSSTTVLVTLTPPFGGQFSCVMYLVNSSGGAITTTTAGNFATTCSIPNNNMCEFVYSKSAAKWHCDKTT